MRNAFAEAIVEAAKKDDRVVILSGDIGNRLFDPFKDLFPERFFNCGVAEENMIGIAAGLALSGFRPFAYTIAPFITTRCLEHIRVDVCYHEAPVVIVAVGGGLSYANNGPTHHSCEDIAMLRALPNMSVVCPGDALEVAEAVPAALQYGKPMYLRLGKKNEPVIHKAPPKFQIGKALRVRSGTDICILSTGNMLPVAMNAAEKISQTGPSVQVDSIHTVKPIDEAHLHKVFSIFALVVTLEEHSRYGGLGGSIAEWLSDNSPKKARLYRIGTPDEFLHKAGNQDYARKVFGICPQAVVERTLSAYRSAMDKVPFHSIASGVNRGY